MELTQEQQQIVEASKNLQRGQTMKVDACAGSGKTSTLLAIAEANPNKKFLYLAFNKAIVEAVKSKFPRNVDVKTTHALAYKYIIGRRRVNFVGSLKIFDIMSAFDVSSRTAMDMAIKFKTFIQSATKYLYDQDVISMFDAMDSGRIPMVHDFYLKKYQMLNSRDKNLDKYDCLLLDEAQDTNPVTLSIFHDNNCARIMVGDTHQSIYAFRGAVNALHNEQADITLRLSHSFRSRQEILNRANYFLKKYFGKTEDIIEMVSNYDDNIPHSTRKVKITRTNSKIIELIDLYNKSHTISSYSLQKQPAAIFEASINVLKFKYKQDDFSPAYKFLKQFKNMEDLEDYSKESNDYEIDFAIKMVNAFDKGLWDLFEIAKKIYLNEDANIDITNAHSAKGLEWGEVELQDDFCDLKARLVSILKENQRQKGAYNLKKELTEFYQEVNLYYVGITRAQNKLTDKTPNADEYEQSDPEDESDNSIDYEKLEAAALAAGGSEDQQYPENSSEPSEKNTESLSEKTVTEQPDAQSSSPKNTADSKAAATAAESSFENNFSLSKADIKNYCRILKKQKKDEADSFDNCMYKLPKQEHTKLTALSKQYKCSPGELLGYIISKLN